MSRAFRCLLVAIPLAIALNAPLALGQSDERLEADGPAGASDSLVDGPVTKIQDQFQFTEGPTWAEDGALYFTDIPANQILVYRPGQRVEPFIEPSMHANGLMFESGGRVVACQMDGQVVVYDLTNKQARTLASEYEGNRFNAPNDLVIDASGGVYFTDPLYSAPQPLPQGIQAFYYLATDGTVTRLSEDLPAPNGIGLSPDGKRLYVVPSMSAEMLVYDVQGPGQLSEGRVFCRLVQRQPGENSGGDGMTVDTDGNVYITTNLGVQVFDSQGNHLETIAFPEQPANVTFGGEDRKTLFVTARNGLYSVRTRATGLPPAELKVAPQ